MKKLILLTVAATVASPAFATETDVVVTDNTAATTSVEETVTVADVKASLDEVKATLNEVKASMNAQNNKNVKSETEQKSEPVAESNPDIHFPHGLQLGVGVSATSGLNGFVGYNNKHFDSFWWKRFGIRFDFASTAPIKSQINKAVDSAMGDDGIDIGDDLTVTDGTIKAKHMAAIVDFYPFGDTWFLGGWRLSGGYYNGKLNMDANLHGKISNLPDGGTEFEFNNIKYLYTGNDVYGTAKLDWRYKGPYLGTGFDFGLFAGFKIYLDAGVVFTDKAAQLDIDVPVDNLKRCSGGACTVAVSGNSALESEFNQAKASALKDAQDDLDDMKFYPMVKMGFMFRF